MLKILITGSNGQLGNEFRFLARSFHEYEFIFTDIKELDITHGSAVESFMEKHHFDAFINCAAYTAVDQAEDEPEKAMLLNAEAVKNLVSACIKYHCYPIHISTDYVFAGNHYRPYSEDDIPDPYSAYGKSKLSGEKMFWEITKKGLIIRTSWLYSSYGNNFVKTIIKAGKQKDELKVVFDQVGSPTYARDLARHILEILPGAVSVNKFGIYHYSNEGVCSWYDFALEILKHSGSGCKVSPVRTDQYPTRSPRPFYSVLDKSKIKKDFGIKIPHWKESLARCMAAMGEQD